MISGIGLFADQFVPKGAPVWKFMPGFDLKVPKESVAALSDVARAQFLNYAYLSEQTPGSYVLCFDDARFFNHADEANTLLTYPAGEDQEGINIAVRDILPGEELTDDYRSFDGDFQAKMSR